MDPVVTVPEFVSLDLIVTVYLFTFCVYVAVYITSHVTIEIVGVHHANV